MAGDYPSSDFEIAEDGDIRRVAHRPTGVVIATMRVPSDPIAVSSSYTVENAGSLDRTGEVVQAALRHLRVWLMRRYDRGWAISLKERELH
jgi:hypothetical protein